MGFAQGFARGFLRQSEMNEARREQERQREFQERQREFQAERDEDAFKKQKLLADYRSQLETRQATTLANLKADRDRVKVSDEEEALLRQAVDIFGKDATLALQLNGRLGSVMTSFNERQFTDEDVSAIRYTAEEYLASVPEEVRVEFIEALSTGGQEAAFEVLAQANLSPSGSLLPKDSLDTVQITNQVTQYVASALGGSYEVVDGVTRFTPPQDYSAAKVQKLILDMTQQIKQNQGIMGYEQAASLAIDEFEERMEELGLQPKTIVAPSDSTTVEATGQMGVPADQPFGANIDGLMD